VALRILNWFALFSPKTADSGLSLRATGETMFFIEIVCLVDFKGDVGFLEMQSCFRTGLGFDIII
jgi:hypothetical protein